MTIIKYIAAAPISLTQTALLDASISARAEEPSEGPVR